jgi:hypothetical protein
MTPKPDRDARTKASRRRSGAVGLGWALGILVAVVGVGFLALRSEMGQTLLGGWSYTKSVEQDQSTYYRLKVKLTYKGELQDFDIVVGCNVRRITYKDNSSTYEAGLIPTVFGRRMSDGKGLVVRPPNACQGETTANGRARPDLMPIVIVYNDAQTLDFGTAYLSDDAYESALSVLTFGGATIEKATRQEFDEFRRTQPNLVSRESYWSRAPDDVLKRMNIARAPKPWAYVCEGYKRFRMPDTARTRVREDLPKDHPDYWVPKSTDAAKELADALLAFDSRHFIQTDREGEAPHPTSAFKWPTDDAADFGAMRRAPTPDGALAASYYPASDDYRVDQWPPDRNDWPGYVAAQDKLADMAITFRNTVARGFAYCFVRIFPGNDLRSAIESKRVAARVDDQDVQYTGGGLAAPPSETPILIFERDEYAFLFFRLYIGSTRGDV